MMTVLVTGFRGKTGRQVAAALLRRGAAVRGCVRSAEGPGVAGVTLTRFDWREPATWPAALAEVEAMYLLRPNTADPASAITSLLKAGRGLKHVVFLSEIDAGNRPEGTDERNTERALTSSPIPWTILRPNWFMQNFTEPGFYLESIRDKGELEVPTSGQATSFVDTRDIGEVAATALLENGHEQRSYTLTGPAAITWAEVGRLIGRAAGHRVRYVDPPLADHLESLSREGAAKSKVDYLRRIYGCIRDGQTSMVSTDIEQVVGRPARSFAAFVAENLKLWRRQ
jgi:uncharacterized protein YbjT (DUF2867 family)